VDRYPTAHPVVVLLVELQVRPMAAVAAHKVLVVLEELRAGGLLSLELPERSFRAETATMKVVVVVVAGLAVVAVEIRAVITNLYGAVGVAVVGRVMLRCLPMAQQIQVAELRPVEASTHSLLQVVFRRDHHWEAVAQAIKTFHMV